MLAYRCLFGWCPRMLLVFYQLSMLWPGLEGAGPILCYVTSDSSPLLTPLSPWKDWNWNKSQKSFSATGEHLLIIYVGFSTVVLLILSPLRTTTVYALLVQQLFNVLTVFVFFQQDSNLQCTLYRNTNIPMSCTGMSTHCIALFVLCTSTIGKLY